MGCRAVGYWLWAVGQKKAMHAHNGVPANSQEPKTNSHPPRLTAGAPASILDDPTRKAPPDAQPTRSVFVRTPRLRVGARRRGRRLQRSIAVFAGEGALGGGAAEGVP